MYIRQESGILHRAVSSFIVTARVQHERKHTPCDEFSSRRSPIPQGSLHNKSGGVGIIPSRHFNRRISRRLALLPVGGKVGLELRVILRVKHTTPSVDTRPYSLDRTASLSL